MQEHHPFLNATEFSVIPCTVTQILHLEYYPSHYTRGGWQKRWGKLECWWTGNTVHVRITSVTIQAWLKIALIKLQQKKKNKTNIFNCIFIRFKAAWQWEKAGLQAYQVLYIIHNKIHVLYVIYYRNCLYYSGLSHQEQGTWETAAFLL